MSKLFVPLDIETTGLDPNKDFILEIAWVVCDDQLNELTPRRSFIVEHGDQWSEVFSRIRENKFVREMHQKSGLAGALMGEHSYPLELIEESLKSDLREAQSGRDLSDSNHLLGLSVQFDKSMMQKHMPLVMPLEKGSAYNTLHYRVYDLSSIKLAYEIAGIELPEIPANENAHRAADDVEEVLNFARAVRRDLQGVGA